MSCRFMSISFRYMRTHASCRVAHAVGVVVGFARKILRADARRLGARRKRVHSRIERIALKVCERDGGHRKRAFLGG